MIQHGLKELSMSSTISSFMYSSTRGQIQCALITLCSLALLIPMTGCGNSGVPEVAQERSGGNEVYQAAVKTEKETIVNSANQLHGIWMGAAALDEALLEQAAAGMNEAQTNALVAEIKAFISTEMAVHFKPDGTLETAIEVTPPGGQPIAGITNGTWKVVEARGGRFVVETTETDASGAVSKGQKIFTLLSDNRVTVAAPLGSVLAQCNPQIILDRQPEGDANVAQAPDQTQTK